MAMDAHGAQSLRSCFDLQFAVFKCIFIYLFSHTQIERGACTQHASHFDLAYDREFFFGGREKAGSGALPEMS